MNTFLGLDGGGTKTAVCLATGAGEILALIEDAPSCYYLRSGEGVPFLSRVLRACITDVCHSAGVDRSRIDFAFFGLPAYGEASADVRDVNDVPGELLGHDRYQCDNDMVCGWAGSLGATDGINVISGTGSIAYGRRGERGARVGGWGEIFGDEGSAYWIGVRGLQAVTHMSDGRLPPGPLLTLVREHLQLDNDLDLIDLVLNRWDADRTLVAGCAPLVSQGAREGDHVATKILNDAGAELGLLVDVARRRLTFPADALIPVSYSGGVFREQRVLAGLKAQLQSLPADYDVRPPRYSPVIGAVLYAASLAGRPFDDASLQRISAGMT